MIKSDGLGLKYDKSFQLLRQFYTHLQVKMKSN